MKKCVHYDLLSSSELCHLDGSWLGELTLPDAFHQSLVEAEVSEAGDGAGRAGARHLHVVLLLQVDHLDPAQAADVGVLLVEVLGEVLVLNLTVHYRGQRVYVLVLLRSDGVTIRVVIYVVQLIIILKLFASVGILLQPSGYQVKEGKE